MDHVIVIPSPFRGKVEPSCINSILVGLIISHKEKKSLGFFFSVHLNLMSLDRLPYFEINKLIASLENGSYFTF